MFTILFTVAVLGLALYFTIGLIGFTLGTMIRKLPRGAREFVLRFF